jgi:predicted nucleic acid-binding protein
VISGPLFIDTWGWVALGHRKDSKHDQVNQLYRTLRSKNIRIYTSDYVLDETITLLFRRENREEAVRFISGIMKSAEQNSTILERVTPERFLAAWHLRLRFLDKPEISFTDMTTMILMKEKRIKHILTQDDHFSQVGMGFQKLL